MIVTVSKMVFVSLFQSLAVLSDKLEPLVEGVRNNKQMWLQMAADDNNTDMRASEQTK